MKYRKYKSKHEAKGASHAAALEAGITELYEAGVDIRDDGLMVMSNAEAKKSKIKDAEFSDTITAAKSEQHANKFKIKLIKPKKKK